MRRLRVGEVQRAVIMVVRIMIIAVWATFGFTLAAVDIAVKVSVGLDDLVSGGEDDLLGGSSVLPLATLVVEADMVLVSTIEVTVEVWTPVRTVLERVGTGIRHSVPPFTSVGIDPASPLLPVTLMKLQAKTLFLQLLHTKLDSNEKRSPRQYQKR